MSDVAAAERMIEALLFAATEPLALEDLVERLPADAPVDAALERLAARYEGRGVQMSRVGGRWRFTTAADLAFLMTRERAEPRRLSRAAQETLAIIAYHQPVTRAEIDAIRGVQSGSSALEGLQQAGLVRMRGRRRSPGRPITWGVTEGFMAHYGLDTLADLPGVAEMKAAGLLSLDAPADFAVPSLDAESDEDPLDIGDGAQFHQDFLTSDAQGEG